MALLGMRVDYANRFLIYGALLTSKTCLTGDDLSQFYRQQQSEFLTNIQMFYLLLLTPWKM